MVILIPIATNEQVTQSVVILNWQRSAQLTDDTGRLIHSIHTILWGTISFFVLSWGRRCLGTLSDTQSTFKATKWLPRIHLAVQEKRQRIQHDYLIEFWNYSYNGCQKVLRNHDTWFWEKIPLRFVHDLLNSLFPFLAFLYSGCSSVKQRIQITNVTTLLLLRFCSRLRRCSRLFTLWIIWIPTW